MRSKFIWCSLFLALFISSVGCTSLTQWWKNGAEVGPEYCRPHADIAPEWRESSPELKTCTSNDPCWWAQFNDPVLNDLLATLHRQNLDLKTAAMRICEARAIRGVAVGNLFPQQQSIDGSYTRTGMSKNTQFGSTGFLERFTNDWQLGVSMAWELDFWGRFRRLVESADANLEASIYSYDNVMVLLQAELAATYIQNRTLCERIRLARHNVELQKKTVALVQERLDAGFVSELDLRQAKSQLFATEAAIPRLVASHRKTENRICVLLGMPPADMGPTLNASNQIPLPPPEVAIGIPAELLMRRPDVLAAERQLAAQSARIGVAEADLYPHISIVGQIGLESQQYNDLFDWDSTAGTIMPGFKWDVLNYGRLLNNVRLEDARFQQALWEYRNTVLLANEEVENALTEYLNEQVRLRKLAQSVAETEKAYKLSVLQYSEGVTDFQRVLDSQAGLVLRQDQSAESRGQVAVNLVMVYKALGGGWQCPCPGNPIEATGETQPSGEMIPTPKSPTPAPPAPAIDVPAVPTPSNLPQENAAPEQIKPNGSASGLRFPGNLPAGGTPFTPQPVQPAGPIGGSQPPAPAPKAKPLAPSSTPILSVRPAAATFPVKPVRSTVTPIPAVPSDPTSVVPTSYSKSAATMKPSMPAPGTTIRLPQTP